MVLAVLHRDQLREDADRDLLRRDGADVEADRRVDAFQEIGRHLILDERLVDARHFRAASDQAEIATLETVERTHILRVLNETNWVIGGSSGAAARLGLNRTTLNNRLRKLNIARPRTSQP